MSSSLQLTDLIQTIAIVITLILAIWQMRIQTRHTRAANDLALITKFDDINRLWLDHPGHHKLLDEDYESDHSGDAFETLETIVFIVFNTLEIAFRHHHSYDLVQDDWEDWECMVDKYLRKRYLRGWWNENSYEYGERFRNYVESRVVRQETVIADL